MPNVTIRASASTYVTTGGTAPVVAIPPGTLVGDVVVFFMTTNDNTKLMSAAPTGWNLGYNVAFGTAARMCIWKNYASGDGSSVTLAFNAQPAMQVCVIVLDGSVHTGLGTFGTVTTRASSVTTISAVATGTTADPNLVIAHEKASTHPSTAALSPTTTAIENVTNAGASTAAQYVGWYDTSGGTATRTATYGTASGNGAGLQIPVTMAAAGAAGSATVTSTATIAAAGSIGAAPTAFVQSGGVTDTGAQLVAMTTSTTAARWAYATNSGLTSPAYTTSGAPDADGVVKTNLTGLTANTLYYYRLEADGVLVGPTGRFRTYPTVGTQASGSFLFGSCQYTDSNHAVFATMTAHATTHNLYGFLHGGDLHYRDWSVNGITSAASIKAQQKTSTQTSNFAALLAATPWAYTWDNHDWGGAASDATIGAATALKAMYRQMVPSHAVTADGTGAIDQTWNFGRISFFMLDTRSQRSPSANTDNSSKTMLGANQKARLKTWMTGPAPVKIIFAGIPYKNYAGASGDRWGAYLTEFAELATHFATNGVGKLYGLSGDIHTNAADDGTNESYGNVPNAVASAFDQAGASNAAGWSQGVYPPSGTNTNHNFGQLDVTDNGSSIVLTYTGYDASDTPNITMTRTFVLDLTGTSAVTGAAGITGAGLVGKTSSASVTATASVAAAGQVGRTSGGSVTGTATVAAAGTVARAGGATVTGTAAVTASGVVTQAGNGAATLAANASIAASGTVARSTSATITTTASITAAGMVVAAGIGAASVVSTGVVTAAGTVARTASTQLAATALITATGVVLDPSQERDITISATLPNRRWTAATPERRWKATT